MSLTPAWAAQRAQGRPALHGETPTQRDKKIKISGDRSVEHVERETPGWPCSAGSGGAQRVLSSESRAVPAMGTSTQRVSKRGAQKQENRTCWGPRAGLAGAAGP